MSGVQFLLVRLGSRRVGLPVEFVVAVEALGTVHPVPTSAAACRGVTAARGRILPVVALGTLIGTGAGDTGGTSVVLSLGGREVCLEVDDAEAIVAGTAMEAPPGEKLPWASGVVRLPTGLVPLLDLARVGDRLTIPEAPA